MPDDVQGLSFTRLIDTIPARVQLALATSHAVDFESPIRCGGRLQFDLDQAAARDRSVSWIAGLDDPHPRGEERFQQHVAELQVALAVACLLLRDGIEVERIGPDGLKIGTDAIRPMCGEARRRELLDAGHVGKSPPLAACVRARPTTSPLRYGAAAADGHRGRDAAARSIELAAGFQSASTSR